MAKKQEKISEKTGKTAANSPATIIRNQKKRLAEAELLLSISKRMSAMDSLDAVLKILVETATSKLNAERGSLFLLDRNTNELYSRVAMGNFMREIRILSTSGVAGHVLPRAKARSYPTPMPTPASIATSTNRPAL